MKNLILATILMVLFGCSNNATKSEIVTIGTWEEVDEMMSGTYTIFKENNELKMNMLFMDDSEMTINLKESIVNDKTRYDYKDESKNDYFVIESNGNLGFYDNDGKISEAIKDK